MRLTEFWARMRERFGAGYAEWLASDQVIAGLGGRTAQQALAAGVEPKVVWWAVCEVMQVPVEER